MAKADKSFSSEGKEVKKFTNDPCPIGTYDLKAKFDRAEIKQAESKRVRVTCAFEALKSGKDGGKNYWVFHDFHLGLAPGKDGVQMPMRGNGLVAFAQSIDKPIKKCPMVDLTAIPDPKNAPDKTVTEEALDAKWVLNYLKGLDGSIVKAVVKHETGTDNVKRAKVSYFETAEASGEDDEEIETEEDEDEDEEGEESDDEGDDDEDTDEDEDSDEDSDDDDEDEDEDEKPAPKKKVKTGTKKKSKK